MYKYFGCLSVVTYLCIDLTLGHAHTSHVWCPVSLFGSLGLGLGSSFESLYRGVVTNCVDTQVGETGLGWITGFQYKKMKKKRSIIDISG